MEYYDLKLLGLVRKLPLVSISPKIKIASFNLLGDVELVEKIADEFCQRLKNVDFDFLVGPEVKVVPLIQSLSGKLGKARYIVLRKNIMGYMVSPLTSNSQPKLVLNGSDAELLTGKKVVIIDDVVSTGRTLKVLYELASELGAEIVGAYAVLKQGTEPLSDEVKDLVFLGNLPLFKNDEWSRHPEVHEPKDLT